MAEINWTDQAIEDVENIAEFIAKDSINYAKFQNFRFFERIEILEYQPKAGRVVPELNIESLRELIQENYRIIYKIVSKNRIDIITIHHSCRLLSNTLAYPKRRNKRTISALVSCLVVSDPTNPT